MAAAQEERFTRRKHDAGFPRHAVRYCLAEGGVGAGQLDAVVFYDKPLTKFVRILETSFAVAPRGLRPFLQAMPVWLREKLWIPAEIERELRAAGAGKPGRILFTEHHEAHAASAFFASPFAQRGDPHPRRRGGVGDQLARRRPRQPPAHPGGDPLPALARPALLGVHLLHRLQGQQRRVQAHGPRALRRAALRAARSTTSCSTCARTAASA